jgi:nucleoside-diphosphate-sugar epimerase
MRVFVAGATGVLGRPTVESLVKAGHEVRGTARNGEKRDLLRSLGATPVAVDLFDPASVLDAVEGCEAVLHLATKIPSLTRMRWRGAWKENDRLRREATRNLVDGALDTGAGVFVQESITFIYGDGGEAWLDEDTPVRPAWVALDSTLDMEREARRFDGNDRRSVVLRFGLFYAPYAASTRDSVKMMRRGMFGVIGRGDNYFSSIHVDDAATAVAAALDAPAGTYHVVEDEPVTQAEYADACAEAFGLRRPRRFPQWLGRFVMGGPSKYILQSQRVSNRRFKEATGWQPRYPSVREGFAMCAAAMRKEAA